MGRKSSRLDKTIFQLSREKADLTRSEAGDIMGFVTEDRIEKIENETSEARPEEVVAMSECYHDLTLCNSYCAHNCEIGKLYVHEIQDKNLAQITLEIIAAVNKLYAERDRFIEISANDDVPDSDMKDLTTIGHQLEDFTHSVDSLKLWMRKKLLREGV